MSGWSDRKPAELQMGNGRLLVTLDACGEIDQLFSPNIDALQSRLGAYRTILVITAGGEEGSKATETIPIDGNHFEIKLRLLTGSQVIQAEYHHLHSAIRLMRTLAIHPTEAVLLDSWQVFRDPARGRLSLLHTSIPWIGNSTSAHCSMYHPTLGGLVHHRGRRWLGVLARGRIEWVRVGHLGDSERMRLWDGERVFAPVGPQDIGALPGGARAGWDQVVQGTATYGAMSTGDINPGSSYPERVEMLILCAESERHLEHLHAQVKNVESARFLQMIDGMVARRHAPAQEILDRIANPRVRGLAERSIDVLHALQDAQTGALMAAAEVDPHCRFSGGYGFSWPRDGAYLASALGAFNFRERVEHYFHFLESTQDPSGTWWQRYLATGHAGPSWGRIQIDEPATVIAAAYQHYRRTQDLFWLERIWPMLERGLAFLESFHGPDHPLGLPSHDLWEERMGIHAYSLAAVAAAFAAGSFLAGELQREKERRHYHEWNRELVTILAEKFVPVEGPLRRSFIVHDWDYQRGGGHWDEAPDISLLGLINPFQVFNKRDVAATRILELVRKTLRAPGVGGVLRYEGDHYRGGNPWILTTLWLASVELSVGNLPAAREGFQWAISKATSQGMLAEQVHRESGTPCWVIPLAWSHAMYLLFVKEVLERRAEAEIFEKA